MNISAFNPSNKAYMCIFFLFISMILFLNTANAINIDSEKRWAEQLRDNIVVGDPLDLPLTSDGDANNTFFSIYTPHTGKSAKGAVILMHGSGAHPDWNDVIHPLRVELPDKGWATLSIQLPLPFPDQTDAQSRKELIEASVARIDAAVTFLKKSYEHVVFISHSLGSLMALNYLQQKNNVLNEQEQPPVYAAIIIGTPTQGQEIPLNSSAMIEKIKIPLLDLYGSRDHQNVMMSASARQSAAHKAGNKRYRQTQTTGANHFYLGLDEELVRYCYHWLNKAVKP